jgi:hypothetical protein
MPLEDITAEWLEFVMFNEVVGVKDLDIDVEGRLLAVEALLQAPEDSPERVAAALKLALPQMISDLKQCAWVINRETGEESPMAMEIIEQVEAVVLAAIAQLWPASEQKLETDTRMLFAYQENMRPLMLWRKPYCSQCPNANSRQPCKCPNGPVEMERDEIDA